MDEILLRWYGHCGPMADRDWPRSYVLVQQRVQGEVDSRKDG